MTSAEIGEEPVSAPNGGSFVLLPAGADYALLSPSHYGYGPQRRASGPGRPSREWPPSTSYRHPYSRSTTSLSPRRPRVPDEGSPSPNRAGSSEVRHGPSLVTRCWY